MRLYLLFAGGGPVDPVSGSAGSEVRREGPFCFLNAFGDKALFPLIAELGDKGCSFRAVEVNIARRLLVRSSRT